MESSPRFRSEEERWAAVVRRDPAAAGRFVYAVATTGVFCRPDCGARRPRRENARFFETPDQARAAGFRPCRRCRPDREPGPPEAVVRACRLMEEADEPPRLATLAALAGMSPGSFHRLFKRALGMTPRQYAAAARAERLGRRLASGGQVTAAIYEAGFGSPSRVYERPGELLGMAPGLYGRGGRDQAIGYAVAPCSLGLVLVAATARGVCQIAFGDDAAGLEAELRARFPNARSLGADADLADLVARVVAAVDHPAQGLDLPLDLRGTAFQRRVWQALRQVPAGQTVGYAELARRLGSPGAARAVGRACASNPVALAVPCHRAVGADGRLHGYRWGLARKRALLDREAAAKKKD